MSPMLLSAIGTAPVFSIFLCISCGRTGAAIPTLFDMASLDRAGLTSVDPLGSVSFVDDHDTDQGGIGGPIMRNKMLAYAYILTSQGYPCVFYRDYSTDRDCFGLKAEINRLIWIHEHMAHRRAAERVQAGRMGRTPRQVEGAAGRLRCLGKGNRAAQGAHRLLVPTRGICARPRRLRHRHPTRSDATLAHKGFDEIARNKRSLRTAGGQIMLEHSQKR
jgi:hypothetical protein